MITRTPDTPKTVAAHVAAFDRLAASLPGTANGALTALRTRALARFTEAGLPTRRLEDWKFTGLDALTRTVFSPAPSDDMPLPDAARLDTMAPVTDAIRLVFINGRFTETLSTPLAQTGISVGPLARALDGIDADALSRGDGPAQALITLNTAFMSDGAAIDLAADTVLERPVVAINLCGGEGAAVHTRNIIRLGAHARATVIDIHAGLDGAASAFSNAVTDVVLAEGAALWHGRIAAEDEGALHHSHASVRIGANADYACFALSVGGALTRQETDAAFTAPGGRVRLYGAYLARGHQHMDHTTRVRHDHPDCSTDELFKGVMEDHGHGVFQGLVHVAPHAVRTIANQKNTNLLLSDRAVADSKPELEIFADDVKCSHGATIGDLDPDEIFYLRARGLDGDAARRLLLGGYIEDVITRVDDDALAAVLRVHAARWLGQDAS
jgi:Fe-S cluster assembly protein SufD